MNLDKIRKAIIRDLSFKDFHFFVKEFWKIADGSDFVDNWHLEYICKALQAVEEDEIQNIFIAVPPGSGKSMLVSVMFPVWVWLRDPTKSFLSTGHTMSLNTKFCEKSLRFLFSPEFKAFFPEVIMDPTAKAKASYRNLEGGFRQAVSFGGLTGNRANYVLVDDPITVNDAKNSRTERERVNDIFLNALQSRVNDPKKDHIIVIAQRTHMNDIIGIIEEKGMNYESLVIPMEFTGHKLINDYLKLYDPRSDLGELMFDKRFDDTVIKNLKSTMLKTDYICQFQQTPFDGDANFFDITKLNHYTTLPTNMNVYMSSDNAITGTGDYNVLSVWGIDPKGNYYLMDYFHKKCQLLDVLGLDENDNLRTSGLLPFIKKYKPLSFFPENDNAFKSIEPIVRQKMIEHKALTRIQPISTHGGNKEAKAQAFQLAIEQGKVFVPTTLDPVIVEELNYFPLSKHDDAIDCFANFFRAQMFFPAIIPPSEIHKPFDYKDDEDDDFSLYS